MESNELYQLNKETLEALVQKYSLRQIAALVNNKAISYYLNKWDIKVPEERVHKKFVPIDLDILKQEAEAGTIARDMASKYGWSLNSVFRALEKHHVKVTKPNDYLLKLTPTPEQQQIVIGSLLGDGSIRPAGIFVMAQGDKQEDYLKWKLELMAPWMSKMKYQERMDDRTGKLDKAVFSYSPTHPYFKQVREQFYLNGAKIFPDLEKLSPLALAIWYMDDGTYSPHNSGFSYLSTQSFTEEDNHKIANFFQVHYGINAKVHHAAVGQFRIGMNREASSVFFSLVKPFICPSMMYKIEP